VLIFKSRAGAIRSKGLSSSFILLLTFCIKSLLALAILKVYVSR